MEEYMAKITFFGFNWAPRNYMYCQGQSIAIAPNQALYALIGTLYGPYSSTTFSLPDLRGRVVVGQGASAWGSFQIAQTGGGSTTTITANNMPQHTHKAVLSLQNATTTIMVSDQDGTSSKASSRGATLGAVTGGSTLYNNLAPNVNLNVAGNTVSGSVSNELTGLGEPFNNMQPYITLNPCILTSGLFPSRN
jgi:microcystin-dependent protein